MIDEILQFLPFGSLQLLQRPLRLLLQSLVGRRLLLRELLAQGLLLRRTEPRDLPADVLTILRPGLRDTLQSHILLHRRRQRLAGQRHIHQHRVIGPENRRPKQILLAPFIFALPPPLLQKHLLQH